MIILTDRMPAITSGTIEVTQVKIGEVQEQLMNGFISTIEDKDKCNVLTAVMGMTIPTKQLDIKPRPEDITVLVNVNGELPEGATALPQGTTIEFAVIRQNVLQKGIDGAKGLLKRLKERCF